MTSIASRWERFERSPDAYLTVTGMLLLLILMPILTTGLGQAERFSTAILVGATVTIAMAASRARRWAIRTSWIASLLIVVASLFDDLPEEVAVVSGLVLAILLISTPVVILRRVGAHEEITATTMWGAISAYLALGMAFSLIYGAVALGDPGSFSNIGERGLGTFNYFSFVTMTTLGFGDIAPVADLARALAVFQTLIGQIYLVVVVARVVSLLGRSRTTPTPQADDLSLAAPSSGDPDGEEGDGGADQSGN